MMVQRAEDHARRGGERSRRAVLKSGAILVPSIMTLYASPAWAGTDYTRTAYHYGVNAGLCRNPDFDGPGRRAHRGRNPNPDGANGSWKKDEFVPCDQTVRADSDAIDTTTTRPDDETVIRF